MSDKLNRKDLPKEDQKELARILDLDPGSLKSHEIGYLRARRDYLTKAEKAEFGIKKGKKGQAYSPPPAGPPTEKPEENPEPYKDMKFGELKKLAKKKKVDIKGMKKRKDIIKAIESAEKE